MVGLEGDLTQLHLAKTAGEIGRGRLSFRRICRALLRRLRFGGNPRRQRQTISHSHSVGGFSESLRFG